MKKNTIDNLSVDSHTNYCTIPEHPSVLLADPWSKINISLIKARCDVFEVTFPFDVPVISSLSGLSAPLVV